LRLPELAGEEDLPGVLPQVLQGVEQGPGWEELDVSARVPVLAQGSPVYGARAINQRKAILKQAVDEREELAGVAGGELELGGAVAVREGRVDGDGEPGAGGGHRVVGHRGDGVGVGAGGAPVEGVRGQAVDGGAHVVAGAAEEVAGGGEDGVRHGGIVARTVDGG